MVSVGEFSEFTLGPHDGGEGPAIFGPVIAELPSDEDAVELWRHTSWLVRYGNCISLR